MAPAKTMSNQRGKAGEHASEFLWPLRSVTNKKDKQPVTIAAKYSGPLRSQLLTAVSEHVRYGAVDGTTSCDNFRSTGSGTRKKGVCVCVAPTEAS